MIKFSGGYRLGRVKKFVITKNEVQSINFMLK